MTRKLHKGTLKILKGTGRRVRLWGEDLIPATGQTVKLTKFKTTTANWKWENAVMDPPKKKYVEVVADLVHTAFSIADDDADLNVTLEYSDTGNLDQTYDVTYSDEGFGPPPTKKATTRRLSGIQVMRSKTRANGKPRTKAKATKSSKKKASKSKTAAKKTATSKRK